MSSQIKSFESQCAPPRHEATDLIALFNKLFTESYRTRLEGGGSEPLYQPGCGNNGNELGVLHRIVFTRDYFASALHEIAHWCIAGEQRRQQVDYGYWYEPDGRNTDQQQLFEHVEVKPQAIEWIFAVASGYRFRLSADNLSGETVLTEQFRAAVYQQACEYCEGALPARASAFASALANFYGVANPFDHNHYALSSL